MSATQEDAQELIERLDEQLAIVASWVPNGDLISVLADAKEIVGSLAGQLAHQHDADFSLRSACIRGAKIAAWSFCAALAGFLLLVWKAPA